MGKRKSKARVMKKARQKVDTTFDCPFCNHKQTVECKMDYQNSLGSVKCRVCAEQFQCPIHHLSDPIDVYSDWIDETERVNKAMAAGRREQEEDEDRYEDDDEEIGASSRRHDDDDD